jgi:histidinol-phosphate aminotransferase
MESRVSIAAIVQPHLAQLTPYQAGKPLEELTRELGLTDAIKLASNENPLGPSPKALAAIQAHLASLHRYPDSHAYYLKEDLSRHLGLAPSQLILGNGSDEVLDLLVRALVPPGGEVISTTHTFLMYGLLTQAVGGVFRTVPLKNMAVDLAAVAQAVTDNTRLILLNSPNNPTGTVFTRKAWEDFLATLPPTVTVVLDEAYIDFVDDPKVPDSLNYVSEERPLVGLRTFSKANFILIYLGREGREVYEAMLKQGVIIRAMDAYGYPEHIRVNVGLPEENQRFLATLKQVLGL